MSQQLNDSVAENGPAPTAGDGPKRGATDGGRRTRIVLGLVLWAIALVMGYFVWQASRQLRATMQARAQQPSTQTPPGFAAIPATAAKDTDTQSPPNSPSNSSANPPLWDQAGIQDFAFTERSGKKVTKADLLGHPWLISFIFTRCAGPCPKVSGRMVELQKLLVGTDVKLVTLTVDPDFDKPDVLTRYAQAFGADPNRWLYLTGDKQKTYRLINESFKMPVQETTGANREPGYEVLHSVNILRVNEKGVVVAKYNALNDVNIARLEHDLAPDIAKAKAHRAEPSGSTTAPASAPTKGALK
jgi:protein SCO1